MANCASVMTNMLPSPSLAVTDEHGKRHAARANFPEAVSDWLNPLSLGTMSASGYIENISLNFNLFN